MPEYLAPGVFVEEVSFRAKSIEGVGTSVAGLVGPTRTGPLRGRPEVVTSFAAFERIYGDAAALTLGDTQVHNHTALAAKAYFDNGGKLLYVVRTAGGVNATAADSSGSSAAAASVTDGDGRVTFRSRFPGAAGNYTLEIRWRDTENLLRFESITEPAEGEVVFLEGRGIPSAARVTGISDRAPGAAFPINVRALVQRSGAQHIIVDNRALIETADGSTLTPTDLRPNGAAAGEPGVLLRAGINAADAVTFTAVRARQPASGSLEGDTKAELRLTAETNISTFTSGSHWGGLTTLRGTLNAAGTEFTVDGSGLNSGVGSSVTVPMAALAAARDTVSAVTIQRNFDLDVRRDGADGEVVYSYGNIVLAPNIPPNSDNDLETAMPARPEQRADALTSPVACEFGSGADQEDVYTALYDLFKPEPLSPSPLSVDGIRYLIQLAGGSDGAEPAATDYAGEVDEVAGNTGLAALQDVEDVSIVMTPAAAAGDATQHQLIVSQVQQHCRQMRYRIGLVDPRESSSLSEVRNFRSNFDDSRLALYYPWVVTADPTGRRPTVTVPPSGFMAGIYAHTDVSRGVHKAPANTPVIGALRFAQEVNRFQQELLNPSGINCLRSFAGRGHRVWGARTLASDPEWKYVNVRRYFLYLERSIDKSTQWVVFESNGERLWANVRSAVESFLYNEWVSGHLLGGSPEQAYFVRCDRSTMTQNDIDNGRLICVVGVASLRPAEFVIFRIGQKTADA